MQIATFCGQQGRIFRAIRAILSGQLEGTAGLGYPALLISIDCCPGRLCLLNQYGKPCRQPAPDSIKLAVAFFLITQLVSPFIRRVLAGEEGGGPKVIPKFEEMVQDLDPFFRIPADGEVINKQQMDPCIVSDSLTIFAQVFLPVENNPFVQQVAIVYKLAAVITPACFYTTGRQEVGLARAGDSISPHILPVLSKVEFQDLVQQWHHCRCALPVFRFSATVPC